MIGSNPPDIQIEEDIKNIALSLYGPVEIFMDDDCYFLTNETKLQLAVRINKLGYRQIPDLPVLSEEEAEKLLDEGIAFDHKPTSAFEVHRRIQRDSDLKRIEGATK